MATTNVNNIDPNSFAGQQMQKDAAQYGLTAQQYQQLLATPQVYQQNDQGGSYGKSAGGSMQQDPAVTQTLNTLRTMQQYGLGQQQQAPGPVQGQVSNDPMNAATNLGAAALNMPAIYNPTPNQAAQGGQSGMGSFASGAGTGGSGFDQSGVEPVRMPTTSGTTVPTVQKGPWSTNASVFTPQSQAAAQQYYNQYAGTNGVGSPTDVAAFYKRNTGQDINAPPSATQPTAVPSGFTGVKPANAPGMQAPSTPFATAPAAPGANANAPSALPASVMPSPNAPPPAPSGMDMSDPHNQAMAHAGMALYQHYGGDPSSAKPEDIAGFHSSLLSSLGGVVGNPPQGAPAIGTPSNAPPPAPSGAAPTALKMATGGYVPGRGSTDTVPALLTPGEYVIPKAQASQMGPLPQAANTGSPLRMDSGGVVPDAPDPNETPEARHAALVQAAKGAQVANQMTGQNPQANQPPAQAPAAPGNDPSSAIKSLQDARANQGSSMSSFPSDTPSTAPSYDMPSDPDPDWQYTGAQSAAGATGAGSAGAGAAGAIGGLASGLAAAAQKYADSIKPWQMQKQAFGGPSSVAQGGAPATLKQMQVDDSGQKQQQSPLANAAIYNSIYQ